MTPPRSNDSSSTGHETLVPLTSLTRRGFMGGLSTALGAAALPACNQPPPENILPYVERPPEVVPGRSQYYATSTTRGGYGVGLVVESQVGRPTKIEGHPKHPASLGGTLVTEQAEVLTLYDPDRAQRVRRGGQSKTFAEFARKFRAPAAADSERAPELVLLAPTASPLLGGLIEQLLESRPGARVFFDPTRAPVQRWQASQSAYGEVVEARLRFDRAEVVLALDADILAGMPQSIRWARDFSSQRTPEARNGSMSRLYVVEGAMTVTGASADHRLAVATSEIEIITAALVHSLSEHDEKFPLAARAGSAKRAWESLRPDEKTWVRALSKDLLRRRGRALVVVGDTQPAHVHVMAMVLNEFLGNVGPTLTYAASPLLKAGTSAFALDEFFSALDTGEVANVFVFAGNPAYSLAPDHQFESRMARARERVVWSLYEDETSQLATWFLPAAHFLESWGDARAYDGTHSLRQPLIRPLYAGKSVEQVLAVLAGLTPGEGRHLLLREFPASAGGEARLRQSLGTGLVEGSGIPTRTVRLRGEALGAALARLGRRHAPNSLEFDILPDPRTDDGRLANNGWLLELPDPIYKSCWGNGLLVAPETAERLGVTRGDVVEIAHGGRRLRAPVLVAFGQARDTLGLSLGWGRKGAERLARGVGVNAVELRQPESPWVTRDVTLRKTGDHEELVATQSTFSMHDRPIVLQRSLKVWKQRPELSGELKDDPPSLLPERVGPAPQWGMTIDLSRCTGCSTCVIACQAENNIPTVGKEMVGMGREMHWMRIDTYFAGSAARPQVLSQPMLCQHCEKAPCEYVCPVNATVHSDDGLNEMVYNRCVGTRFCSNNCPYKVRRFNFYDYNQDPPEVHKMVFNPNVTVRARGVMEKCSYCVQRIRRAQIDAKLENRRLRDGDVVTACEQACPTDAIVFGQVSDPASRVSKNSANARAYRVLNELGTRPRTRYLVRIDNPNQELSS